MIKENVLVVGIGGREAAIAEKLCVSSHVGQVFAAPGRSSWNAAYPWLECVPIQPTEIGRLLKFALEEKIGLTVVGPEDPLTQDIATRFRARGLCIFGPDGKVARLLEGSKGRGKKFAKKNNIPIPDFRVFTDCRPANNFLERNEFSFPVVIKPDGLAGGKGVAICDSVEEGKDAVDALFRKGGRRVVIEKFAGRGEIDELSAHAFCNGKEAILAPPIKDHKFLDGMTGGVAAICPVPGISESDMRFIEREFVRKTLAGLEKIGMEYRGVLYPGLMRISENPPNGSFYAKLLEYNCRFGNPECQALFEILESDPFELLYWCASGGKRKISVKWREGIYAVCIVLVAGKYPSGHSHGIRIYGIGEAEKIDGVKIYHAGTAQENGNYYTDGGRILDVVATGATLTEALDRAYEAIGRISFAGMKFRRRATFSFN